MNEGPLGELETARMQRHQGNGGRGLNISERQVNEGALGELEAANAETGLLNGVCTHFHSFQPLPLVQAFAALWCSLVYGFGAEGRLVWVAYTAPSSQTLQRDEWGAFSLFTARKSAATAQRSCGASTVVVSLNLPFNLLKVEAAASHAVNNLCHQQLVTAALICI